MVQDELVKSINLETVVNHLKCYGFSELLRLAVLHDDREAVVALLATDLLLRISNAQRGRVVEDRNPSKLQYTHVQSPTGKIEKIGGNHGTKLYSS